MCHNKNVGSFAKDVDSWSPFWCLSLDRRVFSVYDTASRMWMITWLQGWMLDQRDEPKYHS